jgi:hypothetical protein
MKRGQVWGGGAYRWGPHQAAVAGQPPSAHAREGGSWAAELGCTPAGRPKVGWAARGGERRMKGEERPRLGHAKLDHGGKCQPKRGGRAGRAPGWVAGEGRARWAARRRKGKRRVWGFFYPSFFSNSLSQMHISQIHSSTNKNRCMIRHDATTKWINPRVYLHKISS